MLENLTVLDREIFLVVNGLPHPGWLTTFFRAITNLESFGLVWLMLALSLIIFKVQTKDLFPKLILALILSAFVSQGMIKPLVGKLRPQYQLPGIHVYTHESDYLTFPSSHAATAFAGAYILSKYLKKKRGHFYLLAALIALSRVYLGVHYPLDILFGSCLGVVLGRFVSYIYDKPLKINFKILSVVTVITLAVLTIPVKASARTTLNISPDNLEFYQDQQVLGATSDSASIPINNIDSGSLNISEKLLKVVQKGEKLVVEFFDNSVGVQEVDEVSVNNQKSGQYRIVNEASTLFIKDNIAKAKTSLPLIVRQASGQLYAQTNGGDKLVALLPDQVQKIIKQVGGLPVVFELKDDQAKLVYTFTKGEKKKFLGIIPIYTEVTTTISADTGEVKKSLSWKL